MTESDASGRPIAAVDRILSAAMIDPNALDPAMSALDDCDIALRKLDAQCCDPGRSPRMKRLADTLGEARVGLDSITEPDADVDATLSHLEDAGAQLGSLQVGCCAPNRLPLYARMLEGLTTMQLTINRARGTGH